MAIDKKHERMAILELRAARGWSLEQAADAFLLTAPTVASWMKRVDEEGPVWWSGDFLHPLWVVYDARAATHSGRKDSLDQLTDA